MTMNNKTLSHIRVYRNRDTEYLSFHLGHVVALPCGSHQGLSQSPSLVGASASISLSHGANLYPHTYNRGNQDKAYLILDLNCSMKRALLMMISAHEKLCGRPLQDEYSLSQEDR